MNPFEDYGSSKGGQTRKSRTTWATIMTNRALRDSPWAKMRDELFPDGLKLGPQARVTKADRDSFDDPLGEA